MKEADHIKKLMESLDAVNPVTDTVYKPVDEMDSVQVGEPDPMTGEIEQMPNEDELIRFDWKTPPEKVIAVLNNELEPYGIKFRAYNEGTDDLVLKIIRIDP